MRYHACKHCGASCEIDFTTCGHCSMLTTGVWVTSPDGPGEIVQARHSGGLVVMLADGRTRQYRGDLLTIQADEPAPIAAADEPEPPPAPEPPITADRTSDCPPFSRDTDPLWPYRRAILARPFPAWALVPQPR